jgi:hypothetical protein
MRGRAFVTMAFFAVVTGVGGGTVRDLLIRGAGVLGARDRLDRAGVPRRRAAGMVQPGALVAGRRQRRVIEWCGRGGAWRLRRAGDGQGAGAGRCARCQAALMGVITGCVAAA